MVYNISNLNFSLLLVVVGCWLLLLVVCCCCCHRRCHCCVLVIVDLFLTAFLFSGESWSGIPDVLCCP